MKPSYRALRRENEELRARLALMEDRPELDVAESVRHTQQLYAGSFYFLYLWRLFSDGRTLERVRRLRAAVRPTLFLRRMLLWALQVFLWLERSALLLSAGLVVVLVVPVALVPALLYMFWQWLRMRRQVRLLEPLLRGRKILLLFSDAHCRLCGPGYLVIRVGGKNPDLSPMVYFALKRRGFFHPERLIAVW